jgi:hypothetical protein
LFHGLEVSFGFVRSFVVQPTALGIISQADHPLRKLLCLLIALVLRALDLLAKLFERSLVRFLPFTRQVSAHYLSSFVYIARSQQHLGFSIQRLRVARIHLQHMSQLCQAQFALTRI